MKEPNPFLAELLERSASGYAGFAAGIVVPDITDSATDEKSHLFEAWRAHLTQRVIELSAAIAAGEPKLFSARLAWSRKSYLARDQNTDELVSSIQAIAKVLSENLPEAERSTVADYIDGALQDLDSDDSTLEDVDLDPVSPGDKIALQYLQYILEGNTWSAIALVKNAIGPDFDVAKVYSDILMPAQREIGRLWHLGDVTVAEEHLVTATTQRVMAILSDSESSRPSNGKTVIAASAVGNIHDIGLRAAADLFQIAGWRAIFLGSDVPMRDLPAVLTYFSADVLMIGATLSIQTTKVAKSIEIVRRRCDRDVKIILGGAAFDESPRLAKRIGADGYASTIDEAVLIAEQLVGGIN